MLPPTALALLLAAPAAEPPEPAPITFTELDAQESARSCAIRMAVAAGLCAPLFGPYPIVGVVTCPAGLVEVWCECAPEFDIDTGAGVCD